MTASWIRAVPGGSELDLLVVPKASRTELAGVHDGRVRVRVAAPPVEGQANQVLVRWLAKQLGIPRGQVTLTSGEGGRRKCVRLADLTPADVAERLGILADI